MILFYELCALKSYFMFVQIILRAKMISLGLLVSTNYLD